MEIRYKVCDWCKGEITEHSRRQTKLYKAKLKGRLFQYVDDMEYDLCGKCSEVLDMFIATKTNINFTQKDELIKPIAKKCSEIEVIGNIHKNPEWLEVKLMYKLIYVCSPLRGDVERNVSKAKEHCKTVIIAGHIPIAPHVSLNGILDDNIPCERNTGLQIGLELVRHCDEIWVFGEDISEGMESEIRFAEVLGIPVKTVLFEN